MAKYIDPQDFEPIETTALDSQPDAPQTATGLTTDAMQDATPSVDEPISFAEAARLLNANESTLRKRWWPRVLEACQDTTIEPIAIVGYTKAGNPIARVSPAGFELLRTFALIAGDVEAIARWIERVRIENAIDDADEVIGNEAIAPEVEPIAPWESAGALAIVPSQSAAIAIDGDWVRNIDEGVEADWEGISQAQLDIATTLNTGGAGLAQAMRRLARSHVAQAAAVYEHELSNGLAQVLGGNLQAVMGQGQPPGDRSSVA
ncbi:hypothetical protein H6G51_18235 [Limnothrix sp. FACHB-708]|uniref:hypothetical protein n=1 Tax=unclassified Limnothrix TaxID=2632864 RepID=UPI001684B73E|nr:MULTISPECIES: hypothetical protein [unclassified Limnothrix]MBD2555228.1 hypothetical protein [Limnothrix sp. FACHB-708]MBD2592641.1 hypothetical protein [Limnothrix sp. FACHB-406]